MDGTLGRPRGGRGVYPSSPWHSRTPENSAGSDPDRGPCRHLSPIGHQPRPASVAGTAANIPGVALAAHAPPAQVRAGPPIEDVHEPNTCSQPTMVVVAAVTGRDDVVLLGVAGAIAFPRGRQNTAYAVSTKVTYQGAVYQCRQATRPSSRGNRSTHRRLWLNIGADMAGWRWRRHCKRPPRRGT